MNILDHSLLTTLLTLAATFLGLSIVVQVVQELYKYLRSSKGRAYKTIVDFREFHALSLLLANNFHWKVFENQRKQNSKTSKKIKSF